MERPRLDERMERLGRSGVGSTGGGSGGIGGVGLEEEDLRDRPWGVECREEVLLVETEIRFFSVSLVPVLSILA